jgi:hypothetical protein
MIMGIPQSSNLGLLLLNIYINAINLLAMNGSLKLFADDCVIFCRLKLVDEIKMCCSKKESKPHYRSWASYTLGYSPKA